MKNSVIILYMKGGDNDKQENIDEMLPSAYIIIRKLYDEMTLWQKIKWNIYCFF